MLGSSSTTTMVPFWSCTAPIVPFLSPEGAPGPMRIRETLCAPQVRIMGTSGVEAVCTRDLSQPAGARLHGARLGLAIDRDEAERRPVPERPLEVVEQRPVEVAAYVEAVIEAVADAAQRFRDVLDALVVVGRADSVLGHVGRRPEIGRAHV